MSNNQHITSKTKCNTYNYLIISKMKNMQLYNT